MPLDFATLGDDAKPDQDKTKGGVLETNTPIILEAGDKEVIIPLGDEITPTVESPPESKENYDLVESNKPREDLSHKNVMNMPSTHEVDLFLAMYEHVKRSIVDGSDFHKYSGSGAPRMKKSGWRKFIKPFNLSVEMIRESDLGKENPRIFELGTCADGTPDLHAEVWIRVFQKTTCPECGMEIKGQFIESLGYKSKSEYWSEKYQSWGSYDLHNLISTARTRAENIGISDLVGFGEVSAEEIKGYSDKNKPKGKSNTTKTNTSGAF